MRLTSLESVQRLAVWAQEAHRELGHAGDYAACLLQPCASVLPVAAEQSSIEAALARFETNLQTAAQALAAYLKTVPQWPDPAWPLDAAAQRVLILERMFSLSMGQHVQVALRERGAV